MKNLFKVLGIVAFIAVIGFAFVACEEPAEPTIITITGIPDAYAGKFGVVYVHQPNVWNQEEGHSTKETISSNTSFKISDSRLDPVELNGDYMVILGVFNERADSSPSAEFRISSIHLEGKDNSIPFSSF